MKWWKDVSGVKKVTSITSVKISTLGKTSQGERVKFLGKGSSGSVYLHHDKKYDYIAVKIYVGKPNYETKNEYKHRVMKEYEILSSIQHRNIVQVYDFKFSNTTYQLQMNMEYCSASIRRIINKDNYKEYYTQLIDAILFLHSNQICHRDLKLDNLMWTGKPRELLKLIDFADVLVGKSQVMGMIGTALYVAPEVYGMSPYDPYLLDMWSMGVILYEFSHGAVPWKEAKLHLDPLYALYVDDLETIRKSGSDSSVHSIITQLLQVNPADRLTATLLSQSFPQCK